MEEPAEAACFAAYTSSTAAGRVHACVRFEEGAGTSTGRSEVGRSVHLAEDQKVYMLGRSSHPQSIARYEFMQSRLTAYRGWATMCSIHYERRIARERAPIASRAVSDQNFMQLSPESEPLSHVPPSSWNGCFDASAR